MTSTLQAGTVLGGQYRIGDRLGAGAMGVVYEAWDQELRRTVALKMATAKFYDEIIEQEGRIMSAITHPGLPVVHHMGRDGDRPFVVMERIRGRTLAQAIEDHLALATKIPLDEALDLLIGLSDVLSLVHESGLVHRDVKPGNVMLAPRRVVLFDFGISAIEYEVKPGLMVSGTPDYLAPEIATATMDRGEGYLSDVYSFGVLAFELLTGTVPFHEETIPATLAAHVGKAPPDIRELRADVPESVADWIESMLAKDPHARPAAMLDVKWGLERARESLVAPAELPAVLVVDDDPEMLALHEGMLRAWLPGLRVQSATDPRAAMDLVATQPFGLILLDLNMPELSGLECVMHLRGGLSKPPPDIIVVSAQISGEERVVLRSLGVVAAVDKGPTLAAELGTLISRWAASSVR